MKKKRRTALLVAAVIATMSMLQPGRVLASSQQTLDEAKQKKAASESTLSDTKNTIANLESKKAQSEEYLTELSDQLTTLETELTGLQTKAAAKQEELAKVERDLEAAKATEAKQYEDMKVRIRYMYENSDSGMLETLLSSGDFSDFLSRAQNMTQITAYDRKMLAQYEETKDQIAAQEAKIKKEQQEIGDIQTKSMNKQGQIQELYHATYNQITDYQADISDAQSTSARLISQIREQEDSIDTMMAEARNAEIRRQQEEAARQAAEAAAASEAQAASAAQAAEASDAASTPADTDEGSSDQDASPETPAVSDAPAADTAQADTGSGQFLGEFTITAYCNCPICCGSNSGGPTASGAMPTAGHTVAMGGVPFGTKLLINGTVYTVEDRGTAYGHVDIYCNSHAEALAFGMQSAQVYQVN